MRNYRVERCPCSVVRSTVIQDHYLHGWPDPRSLPLAYRLVVDGRAPKDGRPAGLMLFKKLQHHKQAGIFGYDGLPTAWQVLDLARVWVHPELQADSFAGHDRTGRTVVHSGCWFSRMVSLGLKRVQTDWLAHHPPVFPHEPYHIVSILSYCDRTHHQGVGYRASGFQFIGQTADGTKDVYLRRLRKPSWRWVGAPSLFSEAEL